MFHIQNYSGFIFATFLFQLYPGPGTIIILSATARGGVPGGMKAVFGTLSGDFVYMLFAVLGLATILAAYPGILNIAQWLGAIYIVWKGFQFMRISANELSNVKTGDSNWGFYKEALAVSLTNLKAVLFFLAFFPLFLGAGPRPLTLILLMAHVTSISFLYQSGLVLMGNAFIQRLSDFPHARVLAARLAGATIMGFGVKLLLNKT